MLRRLVVCALFLLTASPACAATTVDIETAEPGGAAERIPALLFEPEGPGPYPAVVILHDCSGLGPRSSGAPGRWANALVARGYVVLLPDSFTTRGHPAGVCVNASPARNDVRPARRARDAYAALAYVRSLPSVEQSRVGLMGGSHGGSTTLSAMVLSDHAAGNAGAFAAAVALYPACGARYGDWRVKRELGSRGAIDGYGGVYKPVAPLLILIGEADDWTPAEPCMRLVEAAQRAGYPVFYKSYPGAHHAFDSDRPVRYVAERININSPSGRGATTGGDPGAWADSIREVTAFFAQHLGGKRALGDTAR